MKADGSKQTNEIKKKHTKKHRDSYLHILTGDVWLDLLWVLNRDVSW